jgi:3',5'-cyclic-AMP phosphodiesterase
VKAALAPLHIPVHAITGDHDVAMGSAELFQRYLSPEPYRSFASGGYEFFLLDSTAKWNPPNFGLGMPQLEWLREGLSRTGADRKKIVFMHAYPSEHGDEAEELARLFHRSGVILVEMGHTHYNEIANDGRMVYAATRSTGQIEEGPPGFSVTTLDDSVVSWAFKPIRQRELLMITSPADERLIIDASQPDQLVRGPVQVHARYWGDRVKKMWFSVDQRGGGELRPTSEGAWSAGWDSAQVADGTHELTVCATLDRGKETRDTIRIRTSQDGAFTEPPRQTLDRHNALGAWTEKHILGTQLGPNQNGRPWPSRRREPAQ